MTPKKQVSPAIRILRGERDASARATHLEAATRKFLVTTNERKQMSTKTNFKRIALVAVAALGLGVLSSVPSQAAVTTLTLSGATAGTATKVKSDSTTQATINITFSSQVTTDSIVVNAYQASGPATSAALIRFVDSATSFANTGIIGLAVGVLNNGNGSDSATTGVTGVSITGGQGSNQMRLGIQLDTAVARVVGTYTYNVVAQPLSIAQAPSVYAASVSAVVTITVAALDEESRVPSAANSTAIFSPSGGATEAAVSGVSTASTTSTGNIQIKLRNASSAATLPGSESVTVTTTLGTVGLLGGTFGRSVVLPYSNNGVGATDSITVQLRPDGTVGVATITISTPTVSFANRTATFYSSAPASLVATSLQSVLGSGSNSAAVAVAAKDSAGNAWSGTLYAYSASTSVVSDTGTSCSYNASNSRHECTLTGVAAGTAAITFRNSTAATGIAATTVSSNALTMTVSTTSAGSVKLAWDKATYAPGEKATLLVTVLDSTGKVMPTGTYTNLFASGGISLSTAAGNGSDTLTAVTNTTYTLAQLALGTSTDPVKAYTVYMPSSGGTIKASATGGTGLPTTGQVAVSASATVTDSGAAALAAVTALATTVASLKTLITTLTNLVLKIQKKVKA